jgi:hypothetical protein
MRASRSPSPELFAALPVTLWRATRGAASNNVKIVTHTRPQGVRTTGTLDDDVAAQLKSLAHERGIPFKEALNSSLRSALGDDTAVITPYKVPSRNLRLRPGLNLDKARALAGQLEDDEIVRKLELRK